MSRRCRCPCRSGSKWHCRQRYQGFATGLGAWHKQAIEVVDNKVTAYIDDVKVADDSDSSPRLSGRVDILSGCYPTRIDDLLVKTAPVASA